MRTLTATALTALLLGGCGLGDGDINAPLPRMSQEEAEKQARHLTESLAKTAGVTIAEETVNPTFHECVGRNDEVAEDGRFNLDYYARAPLPVADHSQAVSKIQKDLEKRGYRISGHQATEGNKSTVILDASDPDRDFFVSAEGHSPDDELLFSVSTPCLLPPGVEQQKF